jgi:hypothetical protein
MQKILNLILLFWLMQAGGDLYSWIPLWQTHAQVTELAEANGLTTEAAASTEGRGGFVGSAACSFCHFNIYETWRSTRHSYSVLSGHEAQQAGVPLADGTPWRQGVPRPVTGRGLLYHWGPTADSPTRIGTGAS